MNSAKFTIEPLGNAGSHCFIDISINGVSARFLIDTGASKTTIDSVFYETLGLKGAIVTDGIISTYSGEMETAVLETTIDIKIGSGVWANAEILIIPIDAINQQYSYVGIAGVKGVLGNDFFIKGRCFIDYYFKTIYYS